MAFSSEMSTETINMNLFAYYSPGSVEVEYVCSLNKTINSSVSVSFDNVLGVKTGDSVTIKTSVTIPSNQISGSTNLVLDKTTNNDF